MATDEFLHCHRNMWLLEDNCHKVLCTSLLFGGISLSRALGQHSHNLLFSWNILQQPEGQFLPVEQHTGRLNQNSTLKCSLEGPVYLRHQRGTIIMSSCICPAIFPNCHLVTHVGTIFIIFQIKYNESLFLGSIINPTTHCFEMVVKLSLVIYKEHILGASLWQILENCLPGTN